MSAELVHLHVHSEFSMLDGAIRLKKLAQRAAALGQKAVALTDHGNMHGTLQFVNACKDAGVKPIVGCEVNLVTGSRKDTAPRQHTHLVLLAENMEGYANLSRIVSLGWVDGMHDGTPCVDLELLEQNRAGLLATTACMGGWVAQEILLKGEEAGRNALGRLSDVMGKGNLFVELQDHGFPEQEALNEILASMAKSMDLPVVATNDCHYLEQKEARAQIVLQCIGASRQLVDMERAHHGSSEMFLKSAEEMAQRFSAYPEALSNTLLVAERCGGNVNPKHKPKLPRFSVPEGVTEAEWMATLAREGLEARFAEIQKTGRAIDHDKYRARLDFETQTIVSMGFPGYFLIVQDFINWAKKNDVPVGPGRGSGAGSIVAYSLRITDLDPIEHGLLFERFLNPERVSMPDFDVDFCMDRRDRVIEYVRGKYGHDSVGQIATFHQLKSRSVVKDVGRAFGMQPADTNRIASMVPEPVQGKTVSIAKAMEQEPKLKATYDEEAPIKELLDTAMTLEDLNRHAGMHAAGIVISEGALWNHVPVFCPEPGVLVTQYHKDDVEYAGLVKFDFLGLKTLTVIDLAVRLIDKRPDRPKRADGTVEPFDLNAIPMDDKATFALLQSGETTNVFQLESQGMQGLFKKLRPDCFADIVAAVALYRPGPLETGMVDDFVQRKHGRVKVAYPHPALENALRETYGVIVYQEQVMEIARTLAGYSLGGADLLRRAMGKKKAEEMAKQRGTFVDGAVQLGHDGGKAGEIFDLVEKFAGYGFNKSHSAAYALITYQTAFLKAHFPAEFVCATLSADKEKIEKVVRTVAEAKAMGITVLPPDVNESQIDFAVVYDVDGGRTKGTKRRPDKPVSMGGVMRDPAEPRIRFGLGGVKGIGSAALESVFESRSAGSAGGEGALEQRFLDLFDFCSRVDMRRVNKSVIEALVQSGAFDAAHEKAAVSRAQAFAAIEAAIERGKRDSAERASGQTNLFGLFDAGAASGSKKSNAGTFPAIAPWDLRELLGREKNALGFYVSGHPLDRYKTELARFGNASTASIDSKDDGAQVKIGGTVEGLRERPTRTGGKIGFFSLEDASGRIEVIVRDRVLEANREVLEAASKNNEPVFVEATVRFERDRNGGEEESAAQAEPKLVLDAIKPLAQALREKTKSVRVSVTVEKVDRKKLTALREALGQHPGPCPVSLELRSVERWVVSVAQTGLTVEPSDALLANLERLFGEKIVELR
ncbi:MAG: DNA polymerase III subunit alpha [Sandaracinaceae bacterium]|nr:DNA polymerase III subunit alpha [Sandaracinaceae bacterium]